MRNGFLIDFEGTDKRLVRQQCLKLFTALGDDPQGRPSVSTVAFPWDNLKGSPIARYEDAGELLAQEIGSNVYGASMLYRMDRYISFLEDWKESYDAGGIIITERYTPETILRFGAEMSDSDRRAYIRWLMEEEYFKLGLPAPQIIFYLDSPAALPDAERRARQLQVATQLGWITLRGCDSDDEQASDRLHHQVLSLVRATASLAYLK